MVVLVSTDNHIYNACISKSISSTSSLRVQKVLDEAVSFFSMDGIIMVMQRKCSINSRLFQGI